MDAGHKPLMCRLSKQLARCQNPERDNARRSARRARRRCSALLSMSFHPRARNPKHAAKVDSAVRIAFILH